MQECLLEPSVVGCCSLHPTRWGFRGSCGGGGAKVISRDHATVGPAAPASCSPTQGSFPIDRNGVKLHFFQLFIARPRLLLLLKSHRRLGLQPGVVLSSAVRLTWTTSASPGRHRAGISRPAVSRAPLVVRARLGPVLAYTLPSLTRRYDGHNGGRRGAGGDEAQSWRGCGGGAGSAQDQGVHFCPPSRATLPISSPPFSTFTLSTLRRDAVLMLGPGPRRGRREQDRCGRDHHSPCQRPEGADGECR